MGRTVKAHKLTSSVLLILVHVPQRSAKNSQSKTLLDASNFEDTADVAQYHNTAIVCDLQEMRNPKFKCTVYLE